MKRGLLVMTFALGASCALAAPISLGLPADMQGASAGGYTIPRYGAREEINRLYRAPDGHLVIAFSYGPLQARKSGLYDTATGKRAYLDREAEAAHDYAVEQDYVLSRHLKMLYPGPTATPGGRTIHRAYDGGQICPHNPYMSGFQIGAGPVFQIFQKQPQPWHRALKADCGVAYVTTRYADRRGSLYANDKGFFVQMDRFLIWFDWMGHSRFFKGRDDYVLVPNAALKAIRQADPRDAGQAYRPATIREMDRIIARYGARQIEEIKR